MLRRDVTVTHTFYGCNVLIKMKLAMSGKNTFYWQQERIVALFYNFKLAAVVFYFSKFKQYYIN